MANERGLAAAQPSAGGGPAGAWSVGPDGTPGPGLTACLIAAIAAPSIHNTQPWRFRLRQHGVDVLVDRGRQLSRLDPTGRELFISVGAAILNLRVAMLSRGRMPILRLLPEPSEPDLAAQVSIGGPVAAGDTPRLLAQAIPHRRTNRRPFAATAVPHEVIADLVDAAQVEGARLVVADGSTRLAVLSVVRTAEHRLRADPSYRRELRDWAEETPHRRDGVPYEAFGPWDALEVVPVRDFGIDVTARARRVSTFEAEPTIAMLYADGDGPEQWLRSGMALERVLLTATVRGLANTLMTQPLEIPALRALLDDSAAGSVAQAIVRFGYGEPSPPSPRRSLADVLVLG